MLHLGQIKVTLRTNWLRHQCQKHRLYKNSCGCSFNVLGSRLLNMTYPNYLRYLRANGAELYGKQGYSYAYFKDKSKCQEICSLLNKEWKKVKDYVEE